MMADRGNGFYSWNGNLYQSDIVRSAIRPKVRAIGKTVAKHIRKNIEGTKVNPDVYMKFLLEEPNILMTGQQMLEKMVTHLELNNNAFAYISKNKEGLPVEIYPINSTSVTAIVDDDNQLYLKFILVSGREVTFPYKNMIHLKKDFNNDEMFGSSPADSLSHLMEIVNVTDQGIVKAVKNSSVIKWLLKFNQTLRPEDIKKNTERFVKDYMSTENESMGAAGIDAKADAIQLEPKDYVPNEKQMSNTVQRIYSFFNTNENIIQSRYTEDEWISYYENVIEPDIVQLSNEFTRKLFSRRERGFGNKIVFEASNLTFASMRTKLKLADFVDRGIMSPNEVREVLNMSPIEGGDTFIRRLDTAPIKGGDDE